MAKPTLTLNQIIEQLQTQWGGDHEGCHYQWGGTAVTYLLRGTTNQTTFAREAFELWDELIAIDLNEVTGVSPDSAGIDFAYSWDIDEYAYSSFDKDHAVITHDVIRMNGNEPSLTATVDFGDYSFYTYIHEIGHSLGLSHPGTYNAGDDEDIEYGTHAEYAQDTRQYTTMSYFDAGDEGSWTNHRGSDAATPLLHDIAAIQAKYGADMTTRTGNDTYGFNSTVGRESFDFTQNDSPVIAIWDAGGIDTLDCSGFRNQQRISLKAGTFSDIGDAGSSATRMFNNVAIAFGVTMENAIGGSDNDTITGNEVANRLEGRDGDDFLAGLEGADVMIGGRGNDSYMVDTPDQQLVVQAAFGGGGTFGGLPTIPGDQVIELAGQGRDIVYASISFTLPDFVEDLTITGDGLNGFGNNLGNKIYGGEGSNRLVGYGGNDLLNGGTGQDVMEGGLGDDDYYVDSYGDWEVGYYAAGFPGNVYVPGDQVIEKAGEGLFDRVFSTVDYTLTDNVEGLTLTGLFGTENLKGTGNNGFNALTGNAGSNQLAGMGGDDVIDGKAGADVMRGGTGNDRYYVDHASTFTWLGNYGFYLPGDEVIESANAGTDVVISSISYTLTENVEALLLDGSAALDGYGNALSNSLTGNDGDNQLSGLGGDDMLDGAAGTDTAVFAGARASYQFLLVGGDIVVTSASEGTDTVRDTVELFKFSDGTVTRAALAAVIPQAMFTNSANTVTLPSAGGTFDALGGDDKVSYTGGPATIDGGAGSDTVDFSPFGSAVWVSLDYNGAEMWTRDRADLASGTWRAIGDLANVENLTGTAHSDFLQGNGADNVFGYRGGLDTINGAAGVDTVDFSGFGSAVWVDLAYAGRAGWTCDTSNLSSGNWRTITDLAGIEDVVGTAFNDSLAGDGGANHLKSGAGDDTLAGRGGDDLLDGGAGVDTAVFAGSVASYQFTRNGLSAGTNAGGDIVVTSASEGSDTVRDTVEMFKFSDLTIARDALLAATTAPVFTDGADSATLSFLGGTFNAGGGDDKLSYTGGVVTIDGGAGSDKVDFSQFGSAVWVNLASSGTEIWTQDRPDLVSGTWRAIGDLANVENLTGTSHSDYLQGNTANNVFGYGGGLDTINGAAGVDTVDFSGFGSAVWVDLAYAGRAGWTRDTTNLTSGSWREITDLAGIENVVGTAFNDSLMGDSGANRFAGGAGGDTFAGRGGADAFVFKAGFGNDIVTDFSAGVAVDDVIELSLGTTFDTFAEVLAAANQVGADVAFDFGQGDHLTLKNTTVASLTANDFLLA